MLTRAEGTREDVKHVTIFGRIVLTILESVLTNTAMSVERIGNDKFVSCVLRVTNTAFGRPDTRRIAGYSSG